MIEKVKEYFSISRKELRGLIVVFLIMIIIYLYPYIWERLFYQPLEIRVETLKPIIDNIESYSKNNLKYKDEDLETSLNEINLFRFDPNNLPVEDWMKLGLTEKQALSIKKYEAKGGKFYKKEDVKKMYSISDKQYALIEPYIDIPNRSFHSKSNIKEYKRPEVKMIAVKINEADSLALLNIRGVGPAFASRIMKYRKKLGGFVNKTQLKEVYGIDSIKYEQIKDQLIIDSENISHISINEVTFEELKAFPYLTYKQMNVLLAYRKQHGPFKSIADLNKIVPFNPDIINKIEPYIKF